MSENVLPNEEISQLERLEVSQPEIVFDTLEFISNIQKDPRHIGIYWVVSSYSLEDDDLDYIPPRELRLIRNEIFARYGYKFKDPALQAYFAKQDWYKPLFDNIEQYLTPLERTNITFIQEKEKINPEISDEEQFHFFLEKLSGQTDYGYFKRPRMLFHKYFSSGYYENGNSYQGQLPSAENYIYLIHSEWSGCSICLYNLSVYQFKKNGELLRTFDLGKTDIRPKIDNIHGEILLANNTFFAEVINA